jgi:acyl-CoA thioester hydrolase
VSSRAPYVHHVRVRYGEVDMQRVVFNAHYLAYCDDACESFVRARGVRAAAPSFDFMLKKATIEWSGSATVADDLAIAVHVSRWGTSSFDVSFAGAVEGRPVFTAVITYVAVGSGADPPVAVPVPDDVRVLLDAS